MPVPPARYPFGQWSTHVAAFEAKGLGARDRAAVVTVLIPE
jgi:hypothetical protein